VCAFETQTCTFVKEIRQETNLESILVTQYIHFHPDAVVAIRTTIRTTNAQISARNSTPPATRKGSA